MSKGHICGGLPGCPTPKTFLKPLGMVWYCSNCRYLHQLVKYGKNQKFWAVIWNVEVGHQSPQVPLIAEETARFMRQNEVLKHNVQAVYNFMQARWKPELFCCSGRCDNTNWGGKDRLHTRSASCPAFDEKELIGYLKAAGVSSPNVR